MRTCVIVLLCLSLKVLFIGKKWRKGHVEQSKSVSLIFFDTFISIFLINDRKESIHVTNVHLL